MRQIDGRAAISARLTNRLGFGCGRLRAGLEERNSRRLIDAALHGGIRYFDTAPSYGDGASERVLGLGLRQVRREVAICTKIGFARPSGNAAFAAARALLRTAIKPLHRRLLRGSRSAAAAPPAREDGHGRFEPGRLHSDLHASLEALGTDRVDCLMLHEPRLTHPTPELAQALRELVAAGTVGRTGVGTGSALENLPRYGEVAQAMLTPSLLAADESRALIAHGLFRGLSRPIIERCATEAGLLAGIPALRAYLRSDAGSSALLLNCAVLGTQLERVLWSTSSVGRLREVLAAAEAIHEEIRSAWSVERKTMLAETILRYAYGVQAAR
jgi:aryl-alcohol dehydrogenase-like predicted oxidoreductase